MPVNLPSRSNYCLTSVRIRRRDPGPEHCAQRPRPGPARHGQGPPRPLVETGTCRNCLALSILPFQGMKR